VWKADLENYEKITEYISRKVSFCVSMKYYSRYGKRKLGDIFQQALV
jgi:hypothetical protein